MNATEPRRCQHRAPATGRPACTRSAVYRVSRPSRKDDDQDTCRTHLAATVDAPLGRGPLAHAGDHVRDVRGGMSADEWADENANPMFGKASERSRPLADTDDWDEDGHQQYKDDLAQGRINEDGSYREPDEPDWDQRAAEQHSWNTHGGRACDCPAPPRRLLDLPHGFPRIVALCGSTRFYGEFQQANYDLTMQGAIVLSVGFYPHAKAAHGHGEGVGHDSAEKTALDELHKRKIDLADEVLVVSDGSGYFGDSTAGEIAYANAECKPVGYLNEAAFDRAAALGLIVKAPF